MGETQYLFRRLIYIGRDGVERSAADVPALAAHIRGGDIVPDTLFRHGSGEPWRRADTNPDIAALLALAGSGTKPTRKPGRARRVGIVLFKCVFLLLIFFVSILIGNISTHFYAEMLVDTFGIRPGNPVFTFSANSIFLPAAIAIRDRSFTLLVKAGRFVVSLLLVLVSLIGTWFTTDLMLHALAWREPWAAVGLWIIVGISSFVFMAFGLKWIWLLSSVSDVFLSVWPWSKLAHQPPR